MFDWFVELITDSRFLAEVIASLVIAEVGAYVMIIMTVFHTVDRLDELEGRLSDLENRLLG